jgi:hypothetical protein
MTLCCLRITRSLFLYEFIEARNSLVHDSLVRISNWARLPSMADEYAVGVNGRKSPAFHPMGDVVLSQK